MAPTITKAATQQPGIAPLKVQGAQVAVVSLDASYVAGGYTGLTALLRALSGWAGITVVASIPALSGVYTVVADVTNDTLQVFTTATGVEVGPGVDLSAEVNIPVTFLYY